MLKISKTDKISVLEDATCFYLQRGFYQIYWRYFDIMFTIVDNSILLVMMKANQCMQRIMTSNNQQRKVTASFKLTPDLEKHITEDLNAGLYRSRSDAYVYGLRGYYENRETIGKILLELLDKNREIKELTKELEEVKARLAKLETKE